METTREIDLSPFQIKEFAYKNRSLRFKEPLILLPRMDETQQLICLEEPAFGIYVYAFSRDGLETELAGQIEFLWETYALEDESRLSPKAIELKRQLLTHIEEVVRDAAR